MQTCWITKKGHPSCIIFFAGWAMDPIPFRLLPAGRHDLLMVYDYRALEEKNIADLVPPAYRVLHLVAWSMGVWAAGSLLGPFRSRFSTRVAVNGTLTPLDDRGGIGQQPFEAMINGFSAAALENFYRSMFDDGREASAFLVNRPQRAPEELLAELVALRSACLERGPAEDIFTRKLVGTRDRIFPARNQVRSWGSQSCSTFSGPHFPFYGQTGWDNLISGAD